MPTPPQPAPLEPPDSHHLRAATGWFELGNLQEARAELALITPALLNHPDVLDVCWQLLAHEKQWPACLATATLMTELAPRNILGWVHRSYALHELKRTLEARDNLLPLAARFPVDFLLHYNLACYECQLGRLDQARRWLAQAVKIGGHADVITMALSDLDLKPLWPEIKNFQK